MHSRSKAKSCKYKYTTLLYGRVYFWCEYIDWYLNVSVHCVLSLLHPTKASIPTNRDGVKFMCKQKSIASTWLIYNAYNAQSFEWQMEHKYYNKMMRMHYHSKMFDDDNGVACAYKCVCVCLCFSVFLGALEYYVTLTLEHLHSKWLVHMVLLCVVCRLNGDVVTIWQTRYTLQYPLNSVYCVGFSCMHGVCVRISQSVSVSLAMSLLCVCILDTALC